MKELKVEELEALGYVVVVEWNPVKELKGVEADAEPVEHDVKWNPVKELQAYPALITLSAALSNSGIR